MFSASQKPDRNASSRISLLTGSNLRVPKYKSHREQSTSQASVTDLQTCLMVFISFGPHWCEARVQLPPGEEGRQREGEQGKQEMGADQIFTFPFLV